MKRLSAAEVTDWDILRHRVPDAFFTGHEAEIEDDWERRTCSTRVRGFFLSALSFFSSSSPSSCPILSKRNQAYVHGLRQALIFSSVE
jgi:hypothetical protein